MEVRDSKCNDHCNIPRQRFTIIITKYYYYYYYYLPTTVPYRTGLTVALPAEPPN